MSDFHEVEQRKLPLLYEAAGNFLDRGPHDPKMIDPMEQFEEFRHANSSWLPDYALFAEMRREFHTGAWVEWPEPVRRRRPDALVKVAADHARALAQEEALQFAFSLQWDLLRAMRRTPWHPHPRRRSHLRQHGFGRCLGQPPSV